jgi:protoheme IX farnesyltransferase
MLPVVDPEGASTCRQVVINCLALLAVGLLPSLVGITGPVYFLGALLLGAAMLACGIALAMTRSMGDARRLVYASLVYLPALFVLMAVDKIRF